MREIPLELRDQARELYVVDGLTLEQVAGRTGISVQTLKGWSSAEGWAAERREYRQALRDIRRKTVELKRRLVEKALQSLDPQVVYALSRLIKADKGRETDLETPQGDIKETVREIIEREYGIRL